MEKKKITSKDWTYIGKCNYAAKWCRRLCSYALIKEDDDTFKRVQTISLFAYLIIFIPVHILQIFTCVWDGGLKEFVIFSRYIGSDTLQKGSQAFERSCEVWNTLNKNKNGF